MGYGQGCDTFFATGDVILVGREAEVMDWDDLN
jgi:hypothetical protein